MSIEVGVLFVQRLISVLFKQIKAVTNKAAELVVIDQRERERIVCGL